MIITYEYVRESLHIVFLEGRRIGKIKKTVNGFQYFPMGSKLVGDPFDTLNECKQSLEGE